MTLPAQPRIAFLASPAPEAQAALAKLTAAHGSIAPGEADVICALGGASREAAKSLRAAGYADAYPLAGGINSWLAASLPVTSK